MKQNRNPQSKKKNGHKPKHPRDLSKRPSLRSSLDSNEEPPTFVREIQLSDANWQTAQRQSSATKVCQLNGNLQLQKMIGSQSAKLRNHAPGIQRFGESEHMTIGNEATKSAQDKTQTVALASNYQITYGEMVAMADHFESINQMRQFASNPKTTGAGTREEIEYVRLVQVHGMKGKTFSDSARQATDARYKRLALDNAAHFPNPKVGDDKRSVADKSGDLDKSGRPANAEASYSKYHLQALKEAYLSGRAGQSIESALAVEAFGAHYLTDSFSGGHIRTARTSINEYWDTRLPLFNFNLKGYIANKMANYLATHGWTRPLTSDSLYQGAPLSWFTDLAFVQATKKIDEIGFLTFGSVVGRAVHDYDNEVGVAATIQGKNVILFGDSKLGMGDEKQYAIQAVQVSYQEVIKAWELGKKRDANGIADVLLQPGPFPAEQLLPQARPDAEQPDYYDPKTKQFRSRKSINWQTDIKTLLNDTKFKRGFELFIESYKGMIADVGKSFGGAKGKAFEKVILEPLKDPAKQITVLREVIDWVPDTGGGVLGHNQDDNALDYYRKAKSDGHLATLTLEQKRKIIRSLLGGATVGEDETAIVVLLQVNRGDARQLIREFGWGRLHDEIDDWAGNDFEKKFPKKEYAK